MAPPRPPPCSREARRGARPRAEALRATAQGEAARLVQEATAYREQLVKEAEGEAKRFLAVYEAYKTGKKVTIQRLYLERMQDVMKDSEKIIIDNSKGGQGVVPYLPLPEIKKRSDAKGQSEENAEGSR